MGHGQPPRPRTVPRLNNKTGLIAVEYGIGAFGQLLLEHGEQPLLLGEVGVPADIPGHNLLGSHVVYGREVRLAARRPELGDVRAQLRPRPVGREVAFQQVRRLRARIALV